MVQSKDCIAKWGSPSNFNEGKFMTLWDIPNNINSAIPELPNRLYCNKVMVAPLERAFNNIISRNLTEEVEAWDGCFNIRKKRRLNSWSLHSWGIAVDINAARNRLGKEPEMSAELVQCFTDAGFEWGGNWTRKDGMHFQLKKI
ncbi:MAG: hypothetical protein CL528_11340 [Aequorivita sp.]|nr:hypothetical protein [Aequorivita sp.]MBP42360.1 hypothetical protein [Aequorivita sp.]|tara:strand:- start:9418 stop:9849 length:432 start_codon:yes stop_codon:yes gene_type:complete